MADLAVALRLTATDEASRTTGKAFSNLERASKSSSSAILRDSQRLGQAREMLGIRSEKVIQREIRQTEAAYKRMAQRGMASSNELARAGQAATQRVAALRQELRGAGTAASSFGQRLGQGLASLKKFTVGAVAGATAAGYVLMQPARREMSFEKHAAVMANDVFAHRGDVAGRRSAVRQIQGRVESLDEYGLNKDENMEAWRGLIGSGAYGGGDAAADNAFKVMPHLAKAASSNDIAIGQLASLLKKAKKSGGLKDGDDKWMIDAVLRGYKDAGANGGAFLQNIESQLEMAHSAGFSGKSGMRNLLAHNVVLAQQSGDGEAGGEKLRMAMSAINDPAVIKAIKEANVGVKGANGKAEHIDLTKLYMANSQKGIDNYTTFLRVAKGLVENDKNYKTLQAKAATMAPADREQYLDGNMGVVEKGALGKMGLRREVLRTILMELANQEAIKAAQERLDQAGGETDLDYSALKETNAHKVDAGKQAKESAENHAIKPFSDALGSASEQLTNYAKEYPDLTKAVAGATMGFTALTAAMAASGLASLAMGGKLAAGATAAIGAETAVATGAAAGGTAAAGGAAAATGGISASTLALPIAYAAILGTIAANIDDVDRAAAPQRMRSARFGIGQNPSREETEANLSRRNQPSPAAPVPQASMDGVISAASTAGGQALQGLLPQLTAIAANTNNSPVIAGLDKVAGGVDRLAAQPHVTQVTTNVTLPGIGQIAQLVNSYNSKQGTRGG